MTIQSLEIPDVKLISPKVFSDVRGHFFESFRLSEIEKFSVKPIHWVQENHSRSCRGTLRGLHYQVAPMEQSKLIIVNVGEIFDVAVDLRRSSPTFGRFVAVRLAADNFQSLFIPPGFAHGFLALSDWAEVSYLVDQYYSPEHCRALSWNDSHLGVEWPLDRPPLLSDQDLRASSFKNADHF